MLTLTHDSKILRVKDSVSAAQTDVESDIVDLRGYTSVAFLILAGTITAGGLLQPKIQQGSESDGSDMSDVENSTIDMDSSLSDTIGLLELRNITERYVRVVCTRTTEDSEVDGILAILYGGRYLPETQSSSHIGASQFDAAPVLGTA